MVDDAVPVCGGNAFLRREVACAVVCAIVGAIVFVPSLVAGYPLDDAFVAAAYDEASGVTRPLVGRFGSLGEYFSTHWWYGYYPATELFRPWTKLSYGLVHALFGSAGRPALAQHAVNLVVYGWVCALVAITCWRVLRSPRAAWIGGLAFAVHALHAEAVCTLTGRAELFAFGFGLQGLLALSLPRPVASARQVSVPRSLLAGLCFFVAFCSKESALAWVPVGIAAALWRGDRRQLMSVVLALLVAALLFFVLRARMIAGLPEPVPPANAFANPLVALAAPDRIADAVKIVGFGVLQILLPLRLSVDYGTAVFEIGQGFASMGFVLALLAFSLLWGGAVAVARRQPFFVAALFVHAAFVLPTANLVFPIGTIFGERLLFAPSFALPLALGALVVVLEKRGFRPRVFVPLVVLWLAYSSGYSLHRASLFESTATIAKHDVLVRPESANLQRLASAAYVREGDRGSAIEALEAACAIEPSFAAAWLNLAALVREGGDASRAEELLRQGLAVADPRQVRERAMLHASLATSLRLRGAIDEARQELQKAIALAPAEASYRARLEALGR